MLLLAEVEQAERLGNAERARRVSEALADAPSRRRWPFRFFRRLAPPRHGADDLVVPAGADIGPSCCHDGERQATPSAPIAKVRS
jgi:hypothetical protein